MECSRTELQYSPRLPSLSLPSGMCLFPKFRVQVATTFMNVEPTLAANLGRSSRLAGCKPVLKREDMKNLAVLEVPFGRRGYGKWKPGCSFSLSLSLPVRPSTCCLPPASICANEVFDMKIRDMVKTRSISQAASCSNGHTTGLRPDHPQTRSCLLIVLATFGRDNDNRSFVNGGEVAAQPWSHFNAQLTSGCSRDSYPSSC